MKLALLLCPFHKRELWGMEGLSDFQSKKGVSNTGRLASECTLLDALPFCPLRRSEPCPPEAFNLEKLVQCKATHSTVNPVLVRPEQGTTGSL